MKLFRIIFLSQKSKAFISLIALVLPLSISAQKISLKKGYGIIAKNTELTEQNHKGKSALKVKSIIPSKPALVLLPNTNFTDGTIEFEMAANRAPDAHPESRGFAGLAFHISSDTLAYDVFYLRATNGRAEDQIRRNHTVQYMVEPDFDFFVLRQKFPEKYETYVDIVPDEWIKLKIVVKSRTAKLYCHGNEQPTLIVKDMLNKNESGSIALWVGGESMAYYRNLKITKDY